MKNFLHWFDFAKAILPLTLSAAGVPADKIGSVVALAGDAESALGPGTGVQKLQFVVDGVAEGMKTSGASDATVQATTAAITTGINAGITLTNQVHAISVAHGAGAGNPTDQAPAVTTGYSGTAPAAPVPTPGS